MIELEWGFCLFMRSQDLQLYRVVIRNASRSKPLFVKMQLLNKRSFHDKSVQSAGKCNLSNSSVPPSRKWFVHWDNNQVMSLQKV